MMITGSQKNFVSSVCCALCTFVLRWSNAIETIETFLEWSCGRRKHSRPSRAVMKRDRQKKETTKLESKITIDSLFSGEKKFSSSLVKSDLNFNERKRHLLTAKSAIEARIAGAERFGTKVHRINCSPSPPDVSLQFSRAVLFAASSIKAQFQWRLNF